jgi:hypothetical protein
VHVYPLEPPQVPLGETSTFGVGVGVGVVDVRVEVRTVVLLGFGVELDATDDERAAEEMVLDGLMVEVRTAGAEDALVERPGVDDGLLVELGDELGALLGDAELARDALAEEARDDAGAEEEAASPEEDDPSHLPKPF